MHGEPECGGTKAQVKPGRARAGGGGHDDDAGGVLVEDAGVMECREGKVMAEGLGMRGGGRASWGEGRCHGADHGMGRHSAMAEGTDAGHAHELGHERISWLGVWRRFQSFELHLSKSAPPPSWPKFGRGRAKTRRVRTMFSRFLA